MTSFALADRRFYKLAGLVAIACLMVRQNNIIWLGILHLFIFFQNNDGKINRETIIENIKQCWIFGLGYILFVAFVIWNGGVAMGDKSMHPTGALHTENIYVAIFVLFFYTLPVQLARAKDVVKLIRSRPDVLLIPLAALAIYLMTFVADHQYNQSPSVQNDAMKILKASLTNKLLFFIPVDYMCLAFCTTKMVSKAHYLQFLGAACSVDYLSKDRKPSRCA